MKKSRYSDEQIVRILREVDKDPVAEVAKRQGIPLIQALAGCLGGN